MGTRRTCRTFLITFEAGDRHISESRAGIAHERLDLKALDSTTPEAAHAFAEGLAGADAVIIAIGPDALGRLPVIVVASKHLVAAARRMKVTRVF